MEDKFTAFENRLRKVFKHLSKIARKQQIACYRIYNVDLPEFPFMIDVYKDCVYVSEYKSKHKLSDEKYKNWLDTSIQIIQEILEVDASKIYLKLRERQKGNQQYEKIEQTKSEMIVQENGLSFIVNLSDYLDTGLFLDHRMTRQKVREMAAGKNVLNLFAYTGSFTVYAAAGNAQSITSVDMSRTYLTWAKRNLSYNKLYDEKKHTFLQEDVLQFLKNLESNSYDLIILDPPTFSNSKRMESELDIQRDYIDIINKCMNALTDKGQLIFSTNYRGFNMDVEKIKAASIKDITKQTTPFDFEGKLRRVCFLIEK